jgi:hypothetical protein
MDEDTAPCGRCGVEIATDIDRCPVCEYRPAGPPLVMRLGESAFAAVCLLSLLVFAVGVTNAAPAFESVLTTAAIVTPYTTGISAFFAYYTHRKRRTTPTDDDVFG